MCSCKAFGIVVKGPSPLTVTGRIDRHLNRRLQPPIGYHKDDEPRGARVKQQDLFNVNGHVALVTGAASGLGLAFAEVMAENGARVVLADVDVAGLERATARLTSAGCAVEPAVVDIGDHAALRAAI